MLASDPASILNHKPLPDGSLLIQSIDEPLRLNLKQRGKRLSPKQGPESWPKTQLDILVRKISLSRRPFGLMTRLLLLQ